MPSSKNTIFLKIAAKLFYNHYNVGPRNFCIDFKREGKKLIKVQIDEESKLKGGPNI